MSTQNKKAPYHKGRALQALVDLLDVHRAWCISHK